MTPDALSSRSGVDAATIHQVEARTVDDEGDEHTDARSCPFCQGRGVTWDDDDYDGFYALCTHCDGSGHIVIVEPGPSIRDDGDEWQVDGKKNDDSATVGKH